MKTGRDANRPGLYISECCVSEVTFTKGQMFTRCPACNALTVWEFVKSMPRQQGDVRNLESSIQSCGRLDAAN
jgi:hypothetical protein